MAHRMYVVLVFWGCFLVCSQAAEHVVGDAAALLAAAAAAQPGDQVVMADGVWADMPLVFLAWGRENAPIVLRPETPGKVVISGTSSLKIGGEHLVVRDLVFRDGVRPGFTTGNKAHRYESDVIALHVNGEHAARHVRLTGILMENWRSEAAYRVRWIWMGGAHNRIDHCRFIGQAHRGETIVVMPAGDEPSHHRIDHNYFGKRSKGDRNGFEVMRIGAGAEHSWVDARVLVEHNVFDDCDGEGETISNKSSGNTYRYNLFRDCLGELVLRRGDRCTVIHNRFERCLGGVRLSGSGHTIMHNVVISPEASGIRLVAGWKDDNDKLGYKYFPVTESLIANNTIVNPGREGILFGEWMKDTLGLDGQVRTSGGTVLPHGNTLVNNLITAERGTLVRLRGATDNVISHNLLHAAGEAEPGAAGEQASHTEPDFRSAETGDYRLREDSPLRRAGLPLPGIAEGPQPIGAETGPFVETTAPTWR